MATSRTGTAQYRAARKAALELAQDNGITRCACELACRHHSGRLCGVTLNYLVTRQPDSAEPDHIVPHALGGPDTLDNMRRIICRQCNQSRGSLPLATPPSATPAPATVSTLVPW